MGIQNHEKGKSGSPEYVLKKKMKDLERAITELMNPNTSKITPLQGNYEERKM